MTLNLIPPKRVRSVGARKPALVQQRKQAELFRKTVVDLTGPEIDRLQPLEVMLMAMRQAVRDGYLGAAASHARDAAPYMLPRLASAVVTHRNALEDLSIDELRLLLRYANAWADAETNGEAGGAHAVAEIAGAAD